MPALNMIRDQSVHQLVARGSNWPSENVGVMVVFCIVFVVFFGLLGLFLYRKLIARRAAKQ
ncbi:hypothetical protein FQN54_006528 [Arachnomyces sp. PD_36]|nr:hypothetical protein FQN54_006528 [Arachnomyces sp. PD_36]